MPSPGLSPHQAINIKQTSTLDEIPFTVVAIESHRQETMFEISFQKGAIFKVVKSNLRAYYQVVKPSTSFLGTSPRQYLPKVKFARCDSEGTIHKKQNCKDLPHKSNAVF